jgi:hypothetical protein
MKNLLNRNITIFLLINILKIALGIEFDNNKKAIIVLKASKLGYNLQNYKDDFFYDICLPYSYHNMDVTLEYRRKYFFFPNKRINLNVFSYPKRNDSISCLAEYFKGKYMIINSSFYILILLSLYESTFLIAYIIFKNKTCFENTPVKKIQDQDKYLCFFGNKKGNNEKNKSKAVKGFSKFYPETTTQQSLENENNENDSNKNFRQNTDSNNTDFSNTQSSMIIKDISSEILMQKDKILKEEEDVDIDIKKNKNIQYSFGNTIDGLENNVQNSVNTASFENGGNIDDKIDEKMSHIKNKESDVLSEKEKNIDNYSFGNEARIEFSFNNIDKDEKKSSKRKDNKNDKLVNEKYIFDSINNNQKIKKFKGNKGNSEINKETNVQACVIGNNLTINNTTSYYVREEYFYFGYLLARIEDKRDIFHIYIDLLEQCQIIFKFCFCPFNIYEDRKLQLIYYLIKINLYLLFNCLLINSSVINNIFDGENALTDDLYRSCLSSIFTYFIGLFLYKLTNLKRELIRRRYKLLNMRIPNARSINEILSMTQSLYMNNFFNKLVMLYALIIVIFIISFFICFSFCGAYRYTQIYALKGVLLSIYISQISPFILCWIPAILRRMSMKKKNIKLYDIAKNIEFLFVA